TPTCLCRWVRGARGGVPSHPPSLEHAHAARLDARGLEQEGKSPSASSAGTPQTQNAHYSGVDHGAAADDGPAPADDHLPLADDELLLTDDGLGVADDADDHLQYWSK